jgi:hypothetical protein
MAKHAVTFTLPERELGKADAEFSVKRDGKAFGSLRISNGSIVWVPKNKQYGYKLGWVKFSELAETNGEQGNK